MPKRWFTVSLLNMLIAVSIGALLRFAFVEEITWLEFRNFLHAHSHVAILGWVYLALYSFLISTFLPKERDSVKYNRLFWATQLSVMGMLITFPILGYALGSISFSILHVILSYIFVFFFFKDLKKHAVPNTYSLWFVKSGLFFMVVSTFALWAIGPIMAMGLQGEGIYFISIQFYLHFQFNGWFIFSILGLIFSIAESHDITFDEKKVSLFFRLLFISCIMTFALAVTWANPEPYLFWINSIGVVLQLAALIIFTNMILAVRSAFQSKLSRKALPLFQLSFAALFIKILIQTAVVIPYLGTIAYTIRNYVIGFLHLMLIGIVSVFLLAYGHQKNLLTLRPRVANAGIWIFVAGFILSEIILFLQGTMFWGSWGFLPYYYEGLFAVSAMLPLGLLLVVIGQLKISRQTAA